MVLSLPEKNDARSSAGKTLFSSATEASLLATRQISQSTVSPLED